MDENKTFDFKKQLKVGAKGESLFLSLYPKLEKADGIKYDFMLGDKTLELKTDTYSMTETPNFFMEHLSDCKSGKLGGPWRALQDGVDYFVYMYQAQKQCFWFEPKPLVEFLDVYIRTAGYKVIRNKGWTSHGYTVPRETLSHLFLKI
jgi:hypothetical protein